MLGSALALSLAIPARGQLQLTSITTTEEGAETLAWRSESNAVYRIEYADQLLDISQGGPVWQTLYDQYPSHGTNTFWLDTGNYNTEPPIVHPKYSPQRFYRIVNEGASTGPSPYVAISSPAGGTALSGQVTVSVVATSSFPVLSTKLFVDGQEMWASDDGTNYVINTCEWPNGPHVLFATATAQSSFGNSDSPVDVGRAVSAYVSVTFTNLITKVAFSEAFFQPSLGQTQQVTASFAANVNWTLQILDESSNAVRSVSGSGISLAFDWDGTGDGGASIPDGLYNYFISAQTNGQSFVQDSGGGSGGDGGGSPPPLSDSSTSIGTASLADSWYPTSAKFAQAAGWSVYYVEPPPMPPVVVRTNGVWLSIPWADVYGPQPLIEIPVPLRSQTGASQTLGTPDSPSPDGPMSYSGPSTESTTAPTRAAAVGVKNAKGNYGVGYYSYPNTNTFNVPNNGMYPFPQPMHLEGSLSSRTAYPASDSDNLAVEFIQAMKKKGWTLAFPQERNGDLSANSVRRSDQGYNGGEIFTQGTIGLFMAHGNYGSDPDYSNGANGGLQTYFPSCNPNDGSNPWIRMCQFGLGGNLKWMAVLACNSLCDPNYQSMKSNGGIPLKTTHLVCGTASISWMTENIGKYWAQYLNTTGEKVRDAWRDAAYKAYHEPLTSPISNTVIFRVTGYPECMDDTVATSTAPTNPQSNPTNLAKQDYQVYP